MSGRIYFDRLTLSRFGIYRELDLDLSIDPGDARNLVAIRGHNQHGKTSLFHALLWVVYGETAFTEPSAESAIRFEGTLGTEVTEGILYVSHYREIGGSSRPKGLTQLRIRREVTTDAEINGDTRVVTVVRGSNRVLVEKLERDGDGEQWNPAPSWDKTLYDTFFPKEMAHLIFLDKDRPEVISGSTSSGNPRSSMQQQVTSLMNSTLGIDSLFEAQIRLKTAITKIEADADAESHNAEIQRLSEELKKLHRDLEVKVSELETAEAELSKIAQLVIDIDEEIGELEQAEESLTEVTGKLADAKDRQASATAVASQTGHDLRTAVSSNDLLWVPFFTEAFRVDLEVLNEALDDGAIPREEATLLHRLLDPERNPAQKCLCDETSVAEGSPGRKTLERKLAASQAGAGEARLLNDIRKDLDHRAAQVLTAESWTEAVADAIQAHTRALSALADVDEEIVTLEREKNNMIKANPALDQLRNRREDRNKRDRQHAEQEAAVKRLRAEIEGAEDSPKGLKAQISGKEKELDAKRNKLPRIAKQTTAARIGKLASRVIEGAISDIHQRQVPMISNSMNEIFMTITNGGQDVQAEDSTKALTTSVGVREVPGKSATFEMFAKGSGGYDRPLSILNGASRRAVSIALLAGLFRHAGCYVPLVADSLLHTLASQVKARSVTALLTEVHQAVMFYTHDDVLNVAARDRIAEAAAPGRTYTLANLRMSTDLATPIPMDSAVGNFVAVCLCGPSEVCDSCRLKDATNELQSTEMVRTGTR